jgi:hypothetical protein
MRYVFKGLYDMKYKIKLLLEDMCCADVFEMFYLVVASTHIELSDCRIVTIVLILFLIIIF